MFNETKRISIVLSAITLFFSVVVVPAARAEEIVISGNGEGSINQANSSTSSETNVSSANNAEVSNDIAVDANTGNNSASDNTGGNENITTGDVTSAVNVENSLNTTDVSQTCCETPGEALIQISGNGTNSNNSIDYDSSSETSIDIYNMAHITNNITTNANTGNNSADNNNGHVSIKTGDISSRNNVINDAINLASIALSKGSSSDIFLKISGNGSGSVNNLNFSLNNDNNVKIFNFADILNNISYILNTGNNSANGNLGNVKIETGDIFSEINVVNKANKSDVTINNCNCSNEPGTPPAEPPAQPGSPAPSSSTSSSSGGGGGSSAASNAAGAVLGAILPATGNNWLLIALLGNIVMLLLGSYLRLRSGNAPGVKFAL